MDIFKTVTLKNTHQHPNIWICAWGLDTFCTYSYSHAWCNLILHLCCCRDTSLHPPTGSYTAVQDQPVGISGSHNLNSLYHLSVRTLSCNPDWQRYSWHKGTVFQRKCMKSYRWWQGRVRVSCHRGASFHKPLSAEQVKPLLPTLAILLKIFFYLFFIMLQLCMPTQHEADLRSLKILALKLKIEANHSRSQISSLQVTGSLPRKVLLFPRLIIIFPLR